jgi:hypothetical protein
MDISSNRIEIASDVNQRDGIGIQVFNDNKMIVEIFRDDTDRTRMISIYSDEISVEDMEYYIKVFKRDIPWNFIEY